MAVGEVIDSRWRWGKKYADLTVVRVPEFCAMVIANGRGDGPSRDQAVLSIDLSGRMRMKTG